MKEFHSHSENPSQKSSAEQKVNIHTVQHSHFYAYAEIFTVKYLGTFMVRGDETQTCTWTVGTHGWLSCLSAVGYGQ